ncbi:hypothetical protein [Vibrio campbellii]|uniref:hypothetical protein n=1 Tax=Vibrio campbellii TaxID=680 RepID=UPI00210BADBE|nr:hypothetical protein [Vibrio campbellii]UTZ43417.1 hypothetical protein HB764_19145 [Vibrio campbellii]
MKMKTLSLFILFSAASFNTNAVDDYSPIRLWQHCMFKEMNDFVASDEILGRSKIKEKIYRHISSVKQVPWTSDVYYSLFEELGHSASQAAASMALSCGSELDYNAA